MHKCLRKATKRKILFSYTEKIIYMHIITDEEKKIVYFFLHIFNIITTLIRTIILDVDLLIRPCILKWRLGAKCQGPNLCPQRKII